MRKINDFVYVIRQKDLSIVRLKIVKITITEHYTSYDYYWTDNEVHFGSIWNCLWLRDNGKMLVFDTEEQAKKYAEGKKYEKK